MELDMEGTPQEDEEAKRKKPPVVTEQPKSCLPATTDFNSTHPDLNSSHPDHNSSQTDHNSSQTHHNSSETDHSSSQSPSQTDHTTPNKEQSFFQKILRSSHLGQNTSTPVHKNLSSSNQDLRASNKQLPAAPSPNPSGVSRDSAIMSSKVQQTYGPFFREYTLQAEYNMLRQKRLPGVYVIPSQKCPYTWFGVVFIRHGLYQGGVFCFTVYIPESYPDSECPSLVFDECIFHPMIDSLTGKCDVKRAYPKWRKNVNHLWEVFMYARRVFHKIETKDPLNQEAASLYESDLENFKNKVASSLSECKERLYDDRQIDDPHAIRFCRLEPEVHDETLKKMLASKDKSKSEQNSQMRGLSWMVKGSCEIFSKTESGHDL